MAIGYDCYRSLWNKLEKRYWKYQIKIYYVLFCSLYRPCLPSYYARRYCHLITLVTSVYRKTNVFLTTVGTANWSDTINFYLSIDIFSIFELMSSINVIFHQKWSESHVTGTWLWNSPVTLAIKDILINLILIKGLWFYSIIILTVGVHKRCFN
jgi:hypothetical protein